MKRKNESVNGSTRQGGEQSQKRTSSRRIPVLKVPFRLENRIQFPPLVEAKAAAFKQRFQLRSSEVAAAARIVFLASCGSGYGWMMEMGSKIVMGEKPDLRRRILLLLQSIMPDYSLPERRVLFTINLATDLRKVTLAQFDAALDKLARAGWVWRGKDGCALSRKAMSALASGRGIAL